MKSAAHIALITRSRLSGRGIENATKNPHKQWPNNNFLQFRSYQGQQSHILGRLFIDGVFVFHTRLTCPGFLASRDISSRSSEDSTVFARDLNFMKLLKNFFRRSLSILGQN